MLCGTPGCDRPAEVVVVADDGDERPRCAAHGPGDRAEALPAAVLSLAEWRAVRAFRRGRHDLDQEGEL